MGARELNILLVDDEKGAAKRMAHLLLGLDKQKFRSKETATISVRIANDQDEADLATGADAPKSGFDIVILDLKYPVRGGAESDELQGMKWLPELRKKCPKSAIVIQTSYAHDHDLETAVMALRDYDVDEFIPKQANWHVQQDRLVKAWNNTLKRRYVTFLSEGYQDFLESRAFRLIVEDVKDEVYKSGSGFRRLSTTLRDMDSTDLSTQVGGLYNSLADKIAEVTAPVEHSSDRIVDIVDSDALLEGLGLFHLEQVSESLKSKIRIEADSDSGVISTYSRDLRTALHELIENSIEEIEAEVLAGRQSSGTIKISSKRVDLPRKGIEIQVSDNGPGFRTEILATQRGRVPSTKREGDRPRGMGIAVARWSVNRIFGSLALQNAQVPDRGAEATLFVPDLAELAQKSR